MQFIDLFGSVININSSHVSAVRPYYNNTRADPQTEIIVANNSFVVVASFQEVCDKLGFLE